MEVVETIGAMREARARFAGLGLVPTMGFLHEGHLSLVRRAKAECGAAAVTIFVNPTQFAPSEDFGRYPRDLPRDLALLEEAGADLVFTPPPAEMYPPGFATSIDVGAVARPLEGAVRPGHFAGVATVVAKLFNIAQPTRAYFGQKDAQQAAVIRRLARDLDFPLEVVIAATVREPDGLAMSSRNSYLAPDERAAAVVVHRALSAAAAGFAAGVRDAEALRAAMREVLAAEPRAEVDYVSIADLETLEELQRIVAGALASMAVRIGRTRLIDNLLLG
jgi:pantoate--beta-alanine ligase